jgi:hypothetical protein
MKDAKRRGEAAQATTEIKSKCLSLSLSSLLQEETIFGFPNVTQFLFKDGVG